MPEVPKNDRELYQMQQDAVRRVQMMQQRARQSANPLSSHEKTGAPTSAAPPASPPKKTPPQRARLSNKSRKNPISELFSGTLQNGLDQVFHGDREQTLLLILLIILIDDGADLNLVLALLYLIL